jgi:dihydroxyacetone kinase-like predicted kinase
VARELLDRMLASGGELVTLVHGNGPLGDAAADVSAHLHDVRPDVECVAYDAGSSRDLLLIGVE